MTLKDKVKNQFQADPDDVEQVTGLFTTWKGAVIVGVISLMFIIGLVLAVIW